MLRHEIKLRPARSVIPETAENNPTTSETANLVTDTLLSTRAHYYADSMHAHVTHQMRSRTGTLPTYTSAMRDYTLRQIRRVGVHVGDCLRGGECGAAVMDTEHGIREAVLVGSMTGGNEDAADGQDRESMAEGMKRTTVESSSPSSDGSQATSTPHSLL